jgi:hypothetical protein
VINEKYWPQTLENIRDYLASMLGVNGVPLAYLIRTDDTVPVVADDPEDGYMMQLIVGFASSLCRRPMMEGKSMSCCLTIILGQTMWVT